MWSLAQRDKTLAKLLRIKGNEFSNSLGSIKEQSREPYNLKPDLKKMAVGSIANHLERLSLLCPYNKEINTTQSKLNTSKMPEEIKGRNLDKVDEIVRLKAQSRLLSETNDKESSLAC